MNKYSILFVILLICFSLTISSPFVAFATEENEIGNSSQVSQNSSTTTSPIAKDSSTYKILVSLTLISLLVVVIVMRSMIISLFAYLFIISSIIWTIYSMLPLFAKKSLALYDFTPVITGALLTIIGFVILQVVNGKNVFGSGMKADQESTSSKGELDLIFKRAKLAFMTIKKELSQGKLDKTSAFTSDELFEQININLDGMKAENYLIVYDDLRIKKVSVKKKAVENHLNNLYIEIVAFGTRYKTNIDTRKIIEGSEITGEFTEIYCLSRKAGCKSALKGLIEGYCPRCGNPIKGKRTTDCSKCKNELRSGEYDIVLTGISYPN